MTAMTAPTRRTPQLSVALTSFSKDDPGTWEWVLEHARLLDDAGVDRVVLSDHVVFGEHLEEYGRPELGGQLGGSQPTGPDGHWLEPITTLSVIAGRTSRIRLGTNILLAALRRPVVLAKSAATLDVLSQGRLDLGVGIGWQRAEYEAAGLDFSARGKLLDRTLELCQLLWREPRAHYEDDDLRFEGIHMMPKPAQAGGVPLWVSGTVNPNVVNRLARFGQGWIPWGAAAQDPVEGIRQMRAALTAAGRDPSDLQVVGTLPLSREQRRGEDLDRAMSAVPALIDGGVTDVRITPHLSSDSEETLGVLRALVAAFDSVTGRSRHS